uniref:Receptor expression-enhancing protein n=1 Tax=Setaria digitata TaxID=48799 RepID=A0A915PYY6_9BILA
MNKELESTKISEVAAGDQWKGDDKDKGMVISSLNDLKVIFHNLLHPKDNRTVDQAFQQLEQKTHLEREKIAYAVIGIAVLYMVFGAFAKLMCNSVGFVYPAYASVKALFLLYLYLPQTYGAIVLYDRFLDPTITKVEIWYKQYGEKKSE